MLIEALILNSAIRAPVIWTLGTEAPGMDATLGPDTGARRILTCVGGAIALARAALIAFQNIGHPWAVPMPLALFGVQVSYKLASVWIGGVSNSGVMKNILFIAAQIVAVLVALRAVSLAP